MGKTTIEWTDFVWNPTRGCSRVSRGCERCYAERQAGRFCGGEDSSRDEPFRDFAILTPAGPRWTGKVELIPERLTDPLHWRKPRRVFVDSMSDLFHEALPDEAIDRVFAVMVAANWHTYQILTKRPKRMLEYFRSGRHDGGAGPDRGIYHMDGQIWLGVSVEDQKTADERIPLLLRTPAAVRFVSYEPALAAVDLRKHFELDWVIAGGESGPGARPAHPDWFRQVRDQCKAAGVPFHFKQQGEYSWDNGGGFPDAMVALDGTWVKGCPLGWGSDHPGSASLYRVGKCAAGRLLDGELWDEFPEVRHDPRYPDGRPDRQEKI